MQEDIYSKLSDQQLLKRVYYVDMKNRQLEGRIAQLEPYKQRQVKNPPKIKHEQLFEKFKTARYALKIMYVGTNYNGMEHQQTTNNTIQWFLFKCLHGLSLMKEKQPGKQYSRAARTDKGVSAYGNVVALDLRTNILKQAKNQVDKELDTEKQDLNYVKMINSILPEDIRVISCKKVNQSFNARFSCHQRSYKYFFSKGYYNIQAMSEAIQKFKGKHNFINFCKLDISNTIDFEKNMIEASIHKCESSLFGLEKDERHEVYYFHFVANSFLWHQIRYMVTILFLIGMGREKPSLVDDMLDITKTPNKPNYPAAPEFPLILQDCKFKDLQFDITKNEGVNICNTLNGIIMSKVMEMTLFVNCLEVMKSWGLKSIGLGQDALIKQAIEQNRKREINNVKKIQFSKATGIAYSQKQELLKGKSKELHEKKIQKRMRYDQKINGKQEDRD